MANPEYRDYPALSSTEVVGGDIITFDLPRLVGSFWVRRTTRFTNGLGIEVWQLLGVGFRGDFTCIGGKPHISAWVGPLKSQLHREKALVKVAGLLGVETNDVEVLVTSDTASDDPDVFLGGLTPDEMDAALARL